MGVSSGSSNQSSSSNSYGYSQNLAQSINASQSNVWGDQARFLTSGYSQASDLSKQQSGTIQQDAAKYGTQGYSDSQAGVGALRDVAGSGGASATYANPNNDLAKSQLAAMTADIGDQFRRSILPSIQSSAGQVGAIGGSRAALAKGVAAGDASRAISSAATDLYGQQYQIGASSAAQADSNRINAGGALPGAATASYNLGLSPYSSAWGPISSMMAAIGGPTVLSNSMGVSQAQSGSENWGQSSSSGSSRNWGFQFF
jgi:hypothetical protein